jgi:DNA-directed RNA polymerase specialized sigma subunit
MKMLCLWAKRNRTMASDSQLYVALRAMVGNGTLISSNCESDNATGRLAGRELVFLVAGNRHKGLVERAALGSGRSLKITGEILRTRIKHWESMRTRLLDYIDRLASRHGGAPKPKAILSKVMGEPHMVFALIKSGGIEKALNAFEKRNARFAEMDEFWLKDKETGAFIHSADGNSIRLAKLRDPAAITALYLATIYFSRSFSQLFASVFLALGVNHADVESILSASLLDAADRYDPLRKGVAGRPVSFNTALYYSLFSRIIRLIETEREVRLPAHVNVKLARIGRAIGQEQGRIDEEKIAKLTGILAEDLSELLAQRNTKFISLSIAAQEEKMATMESQIGSEPEWVASINSEFARWAVQQLNSLPEPKRTMLRCYYGFIDPLSEKGAGEIAAAARKTPAQITRIARRHTMANSGTSIGDMFGVTRERVRQIVEAQLVRIRQRARASGMVLAEGRMG